MSGGFTVRWWRACPCAGDTQNPIREDHVWIIEEAWKLIRGAGGKYRADKSSSGKHVYYAGKSKTWISLERG